MILLFISTHEPYECHFSKYLKRTKTFQTESSLGKTLGRSRSFSVSQWAVVMSCLKKTNVCFNSICLSETSSSCCSSKRNKQMCVWTRALWTIARNCETHDQKHEETLSFVSKAVKHWTQHRCLHCAVYSLLLGCSSLIHGQRRELCCVLPLSLVWIKPFGAFWIWH